MFGNGRFRRVFIIVVGISLTCAVEDSTKERNCKQTKKCDRAAGTCMRNVQECNYKVGDEKCRSGCVCCLDGGICAGATNKRCIRLGGKCKPLCRKGEREVNNGCEGKNCTKCCVKRCNESACDPSPACQNAEGYCVCKKEDCPLGKVDRGACKGPGCMCCLPPLGSTTETAIVTPTKIPIEQGTSESPINNGASESTEDNTIEPPSNNFTELTEVNST